MTTDFVIILTSTTGKQEAEKIASFLLNKKLIACANIIGPITSFFRWKEREEHTEEYLLMMKSMRNLFERVVETVKTMHSYEVPEVLVLPIEAGSKSFLGWLQNCLE